MLITYNLGNVEFRHCVKFVCLFTNCVCTPLCLYTYMSSRRYQWKTSAIIDFGNCDNSMLSTADKVLARNVWIRHRTVLARVSDTGTSIGHWHEYQTLHEYRTLHAAEGASRSFIRTGTSLVKWLVHHLRIGKQTHHWHVYFRSLLVTTH